MSEEEKTPTEAFKDLKEKAKTIIDLIGYIPLYLQMISIRDNIRTLQVHSRSINQSVLFVSTWKKFFKGISDIEPKFTEFITLSRQISDKINTDILFLENIIKQIDENKDKTAYGEYQKYMDNIDEYHQELDRFSVLFIEIRNVFIEEGEIPILPDAPVIEHIKFIDSKEHDTWKDSG